MPLPAELRPPGVYPAAATVPVTGLRAANTDVPGFIGLAVKGPLNTPTRITGWEHFTAVFGGGSHYYLAPSVEAFFRNGGRTCYVVRVAHAAAAGEAPGPEHAARAERVLSDDWKKPTLRVCASSEGRWGNDVWVGFKHSTGASALLTRDLEVGAGEAWLASARGFEVGQLVRIFDRDNEDFVTVTEVEGKTVRWGAATPVNRRYRAAAPTQLEVISFEMQVALRHRREVFKGLQMDPTSARYAPRVVAAESQLVDLVDLGSGSPAPNNLPDPEPLTKIAGGRDGLEALAPEDFIGADHGPGARSGLMSLVVADEVALVACPDAMVFLDRDPGPAGEMRTQRVQDAMVDLCENLRDRFAILDCPRSRSIEKVVKWRRRTDSAYCAYYWPWLEMSAQPGEPPRELPPSGVMAGIFAERELASGVHVAPANVVISGAVDLGLRVTEDHLGLLNAEGINSFRIQRGIRPWGARTASSDPDWRYINVRRLFNMLRRSLDVGMGWLAFEPNNAETWSNVSDRTGQFLGELFQQGMFAGGNAAEAFFVKCDEETNPPDAVNRGQLVCLIGVAPVIPTEYIMIDVVQETSDA